VTVDLSLLHPLRDDSSLHYQLNTEQMFLGLTNRGTNHILVLHLNRPELIEYRHLQRERQQEHEEYLSLLRLFRAQETELEAITRRLKEFERGS
jgi:hypothetical protein